MAKSFMDRAAGAFMQFPVSVKRWEGVQRSARARSLAEEHSGASQGVVNASVNLLGKHHADLKRVKAAGAKINTYLYDNALPADVDGVYMFHVQQIPKVVSDLQKLKAEAEAELERFLVEYDRFVRSARSDLSDLGKGISYPSAAEVREKFTITIGTPDFVPMADLKRFKHLPVAQAKQWAEQAEASVAQRFDRAREFILDSTYQFLSDLEKSLAAGTYRATEKKAREVEHLTTQLRQLVVDFDNDPRLLALAETLANDVAPLIKSGKRITSMGSVEISGTRKAAKTVVKGIDDHRKNKAKLASSAKSNKSAKSAGTPVGGMLADLV